MSHATSSRPTSRHISSTPTQHWYTQLTLDLCISALSKSLFHPFIACLLPLCLRALAAPYTSRSFILTSAFAIAVCTYHALDLISQRVAFGPPREVDWEKEVVVITGGLGGLGGCIAEIYGLRGVSVAVLDIQVSKDLDGEEKEGVHYYHCNVADPQATDRAFEKITHDIGVPTILINNAAITCSSPLLHTQPEDIERLFRINTLSHFHLARHFLRPLLKRHNGGTLVTVSSVLGHSGAANLSAYTASKAALLAYHASLTAELAASAPQMKTILVAPGQLDTQLFADVSVQGWLQRFLAPVVGAGELAVRIVEMVGQGRGGEIRVPEYARWMPLLGGLPVGLQRGLRWWSGLDAPMGNPGEGDAEGRGGVDIVDSDTEGDSEGSDEGIQ